jgi:hypothetical protein
MCRVLDNERLDNERLGRIPIEPADDSMKEVEVLLSQFLHTLRDLLDRRFPRRLLIVIMTIMPICIFFVHIANNQVGEAVAIDVHQARRLKRRSGRPAAGTNVKKTIIYLVFKRKSILRQRLRHLVNELISGVNFTRSASGEFGL